LIEREEHLRSYSKLIREGAVGFVTQAVGKELLFKAAAAAARGETWFQEGLFARIMPEAFGAKEYRGKVELDSTEREILNLVANGETNKEIASRLKCSERTVKTRLAVLRRKTGAKNRSRLASYAVANELARLAENGP
jgi:DNA-binding NarL/FixJ family response regulator